MSAILEINLNLEEAELTQIIREALAQEDHEDYFKGTLNDLLEKQFSMRNKSSNKEYNFQVKFVNTTDRFAQMYAQGQELSRSKAQICQKSPDLGKAFDKLHSFFRDVLGA